MPHATVPSPGLQAIILCGPGESLSTFTSIPKDFPKALIPIANRPMVWYPLDWCYRMGINDITLVTPPESQQALESALATHPALTSLPSPKPELIAPADLTPTTGTGLLLRLPEVQKAITSDFVVLPCDLISELDGTRLIQQWMTLNPLSISARGTKRKGGLAVFYPTHGLEGISHKKDETDFIATVPLDVPAVPAPQGSLRPDIEQLAIAMPTDTLNDKVEDGKGTFQLRSQLSGKYGRVNMKTKHRDAHIYIFPKWVKDYAARNERFDSISEDVLGWWAKAQWQNGLSEKISLDEALGQTADSSEDMESSQLEEPITEAATLSTTKSSSRLGKTKGFASRVAGSAPAPAIEALDVPSVLAYVQPTPTSTSPQPLIRRVDNSHALLNISLYLAKQQAHQLGHEYKVHPTAILAQQARVSQEDSLVAENVKIGFRSNIKESVIGANCDIGAGARLTRCLLMDGVTVGDGVQMVGCIIGRRARIQGLKPQDSSPAVAEGDKKKSKKPVDDDDEKTKLTECEVAPNFVVEAGTEAKGEKMMPFDTEDMDDLEEDEDED
ncbi:putative translation initiation factor eIF-2B subunit gamma [Pseudocercospora fuligena]|uniref:Translation initiation factor eIF2B subunit gamma n=1 Tax=Pseudocercospora fuligena TaxID=685502 RepID=A0A8H6VHI5_9PEZI|nr:putative translation initiation factor eIF-2B subunit gamma [Pseudocercospora fuligena]